MKKTIASLAILGLSVTLATPSSASTLSGSKCSKVNQTSTVDNVKYTCIKSGKKLVWNKGVKSETISVSKVQASLKALAYLKMMPFSRLGLIEQLEYEGFSNADASYGVDAAKADWNDQAAKKAAKYLKMMPFSRISLTEQLLYEKYTPAQAEYGVSTTGL